MNYSLSSRQEKTKMDSEKKTAVVKAIAVFYAVLTYSFLNSLGIKPLNFATYLLFR